MTQEEFGCTHQWVKEAGQRLSLDPGMYSDQERGSDITKKGQSGGGGHYPRETAGSTLVLWREWEMACCAGSPEGRNCKCHETPEDPKMVDPGRWHTSAIGPER